MKAITGTLLIGAALLLGGLPRATRAADGKDAEAALARSVPELARMDEATLARWAALELPLRIEGRYSVLAPGLLRMARWEVPCVPVGGVEFARPRNMSPTIELTGRLALRDDRRVFLVETLTPLPNDQDVYVARRAAIDPMIPAEWYALGNWALDRGRFYDDEALVAQGNAALLSGFSLERRRVAADDAAGLRGLAEQAGKVGLPERFQRQLIHEAWLAEWDSARGDKGGSLGKLAERLARDLPGAATPLPAPEPKLRAEYLADPRRTYADADSERRPVLHRILYKEVLLAELLRQVEPDAANGSRIADRIDAWIPERHEVAEDLREREIAGAAQRLPSMDQAAMLVLARRIRARNQPDRARRTIADWLAFAEDRARRDGPAALVRIADQYRDLLEDDAKQLELLVEAHRASGHAADIGIRLAELGYRFREGRWIRESDRPDATRPPAIDAAILEGRVLVGMTPAQVRMAWRAPDAVARLATAGDVTEIWKFTEPGRSAATTVHFRRRPEQNPEDARAISVHPAQK